MLDHGRVGQSRVRAAQVLGDVWMQAGEALDVQLVQDRVGHRDGGGQRGRRRGVGDDDGERHGVERVPRVRLVVRLLRVVEDGAAIVDPTGDRPGVRVEQQLGRVEPGAGVRRPVAVDAVAVPLAGRHPADDERPDAVVAAVHLEIGLALVLPDQDQLDPGGAR